MAERIVYGQEDLKRALCDGLTSITLCAGIYDLPLAPGVVFDRLGPVCVSVQATRREAEDAGMCFIEIYPEYKAEYALDSRVPLWHSSSGSGGSHIGSGGSYTRLRTGSGGSYIGSYIGSGGAYIGSGSYHAGSLFMQTSFGSFVSSGAGFKNAAAIVFGYGIDLI
ncbi:MAG: hypothetical protein IJH37_01060 [Clostridia bacterium]|nr:hypothetical protein [Clostridia bacterium]